jgi:hypothetical protein
MHDPTGTQLRGRLALSILATTIGDGASSVLSVVEGDSASRSAEGFVDSDSEEDAVAQWRRIEAHEVCACVLCTCGSPHPLSQSMLITARTLCL